MQIFRSELLAMENTVFTGQKQTQIEKPRKNASQQKKPKKNALQLKRKPKKNALQLKEKPKKNNVWLN